VKVLITCKIGTEFSCCDFHEKIKSSRDFLKKVGYCLQKRMIGLGACVNQKMLEYCFVS